MEKTQAITYIEKYFQRFTVLQWFDAITLLCYKQKIFYFGDSVN